MMNEVQDFMDRREIFSIQFLMTVVFMVAADVAILRALWANHQTLLLASLSTLPSINLLLLMLPRARGIHDSCRFWFGFQACGWIVVVCVFLLVLVGEPTVLFAPLFWLEPIYPRPLGSDLENVIQITTVISIYTPIQLIPAAFCGQFAKSYRVRIERRESNEIES